LEVARLQAVPQKERSKAQKIDVRPAASVGEIFAVDSFNSEMSVKICLIWGILNQQWSISKRPQIL
jgi:hypothetical protein